MIHLSFIRTTHYQAGGHRQVVPKLFCCHLRNRRVRRAVAF